MSGRKFQNNVIAVAIGGRAARKSRFRLSCCNRGTLNDSASWIWNCSSNVSRDLLSRQTETNKHYKCQHLENDFHVAFEPPEDLQLLQNDAGASRETRYLDRRYTAHQERIAQRKAG